jgi:hypothetical protein
MPFYQITPHDLLMFRDGRPIEPLAGSGAHGGRWPEPSILFDALHAALHRAFPASQAWEHPHRFGRSGDRDYQRPRTQRFGSLATAGPFPILDGEWLFPAPQDVSHPGEFEPSMLPLADDAGLNRLPQPLQHSLGSQVPAGKNVLLPWWNKAAFEQYLGWHPRSNPAAFADDDLFLGEWTIGIGLDSVTGTAGRGEARSQIYSAEYLRLRQTVTMGVHAQMSARNGNGGPVPDQLTRLFPASQTIIVGGQQRACHIQPMDAPLADVLPLSPEITGDRVKWVLLSAAIYPRITANQSKGISGHQGGWLPTWIAPHDGFRVRQGEKEVEVKGGQVLLKRALLKQPDQSRDARRKQIRAAPFLDCRLVAARIPKPTVVTGWTERLHLKDDPHESDPARRAKGARPTLLAVPAGAAYYFQGPDAPLLADALAWHGAQPEPARQLLNRRSTLLGEKGFGLGVCGLWNPF